MAQIVCIVEGTYREGINEIGDIVACHDDDVDLSGAGYENFRVIKVAGYTAEQVRKFLGAKLPEQNMAFYSTVGNRWTLERPQEKQVWRNEKGLWCFLEKLPKYQLTVKNLTLDDEDILASKLTALEQKLAVLGKVLAKIPLDSANLTEVEDLNA